MSDCTPARCMKETDELQHSCLHVQRIIKKEENSTYVLRWTIQDYRSLAFGIQYNAHHIRIGKTLHRLRIVKYLTRIRNHPIVQRLVHVHLGLTPSSPDAQVAISILHSKDVEIQPTIYSRAYFPHLLNKKCYFSFVESPEFFKDAGYPTVICRITIQREDVELHIEKNSLVSNDLGDLFLDGKFSDISILVGDAEFKAHSAILAARSPVFDAMLRHEMREKTERTLQILDFSPESVRELLWYLYTGRTNPLSVDTALPLLQLADKYDVQELKSDLEEFLRSNISIDDVLNILVAADMCSAQSLKNDAIEYVAYNLGKVMKRSEWKTFRRSLDLVDEIMFLFSEIYATDF